MRTAIKDKGLLHKQAWVCSFTVSALVMVSFNPLLTFSSFSVICFLDSAPKIHTADKYVSVHSITCINKMEVNNILQLRNGKRNHGKSQNGIY